MLLYAADGARAQGGRETTTDANNLHCVMCTNMEYQGFCCMPFSACAHRVSVGLRRTRQSEQSTPVKTRSYRMPLRGTAKGKTTTIAKIEYRKGGGQRRGKQYPETQQQRDGATDNTRQRQTAARHTRKQTQKRNAGRREKPKPTSSGAAQQTAKATAERNKTQKRTYAAKPTPRSQRGKQEPRTRKHNE